VTQLENVNGSKVLAVVSALESEGKSTVSANLAKALALGGRRVLIFDADFRKPQIRPHFSDPDGPGLESLLKGEANLDQAIKRSPVLGVDILGARQRLDEAAELAAFPRCEEAIRAARERYDFVVIDSAPVLAVSEASRGARTPLCWLFGKAKLEETPFLPRESDCRTCTSM
jgi:Mrp family chromosome partitioning ATPase